MRKFFKKRLGLALATVSMAACLFGIQVNAQSDYNYSTSGGPSGHIYFDLSTTAVYRYCGTTYYHLHALTDQIPTNSLFHTVDQIRYTGVIYKRSGDTVLYSDIHVGAISASWNTPEYSMAELTDAAVKGYVTHIVVSTNFGNITRTLTDE